MRAWLVSLVAHVGVVAVACFLLAGMLWNPTPADANIGAGMVWLFLIGALALPWSALTFSGVLPEQRDSVEMILFISFALFNVLLHGAVALVRTRPMTPAPPQLPGTSPAGPRSQ